MNELASEQGVNIRPPLASTAALRDLEPTEEEKLRQWQQERLERRLRGEYESATRRLGEVVSASLHSPARIADVRVQGPTATRPSFLGFLIRPHLNSPTPPSITDGSMQDVLRRVGHMTSALERSDIFSSVQPTLERSRSALAGENDVDVILKVRDRSRMFLKGSTETGNGEGSATATARFRNVFGGAETLEGSVSFGTTTRRAFQVRLESPLTPTLDTRGEISAFQFDRDQTVFASSTENVSGLKATARTHSPLGVHEFGYEAALRRIKGLTPMASASLRESAGQTVKSSIFHSIVHDSRDSTTMGSTGSYFKLVQEVAGLGGDAHHLKTETDASISRGLFHGAAISLTARAGSLIPFFGKPSLFSDRFQLGGPTSLRMFRHNGLGPKDGGTVSLPTIATDSIGGELMWAGGLSLISDIPRKAHWPLKSHIFVNAGRLDRLDLEKSLSATARGLFMKPAVSAGVGLIYRLDPVRLEVNFGVPLVASKTDKMRRGFQMGIGLEFL